jgi:DNA-binding HxlR family transcriptional regulator
MKVSSHVNADADDQPVAEIDQRFRYSDLVCSGRRTEGACPTRTVLGHVTSKWGVLLLVALSEQDLRWGELRRVVEGISEKMLAQTLRTLEGDGLVSRTVTATIPPRVDYALTSRGRELVEHLLPLMDWIHRNAEAILTDAARARHAP